MIKKYTKLQDFVMDPAFKAWVLNATPEAENYWRAWLQSHPDKSELFKQARTLVLNLQEGAEKLQEEEKALMWANIQARKVHAAPSDDTFGYSDRGGFMRNWRYLSGIAACVTALLLIGAVLFLSKATDPVKLVSHVTQFGEIKNIALPDGSTVVLNANSQVSFADNFDTHEVREVLLKGEAFFSVSHKSNNQKFKVKLAENIHVEVLGTQFTVTSRPEKTRVVLSEGKVKLNVLEEAMMGLSSFRKVEEVLKPGELIELGSRQEVALKKNVLNPEVFSAFQHNKIAFVDTPLFEVARVLEDTYGYEVKINGTGVGNRRFTGTVPFDRVDMLLAALEKLFNLQIVRQDKQINIS